MVIKNFLQQQQQQGDLLSVMEHMNTQDGTHVKFHCLQEKKTNGVL